MFGVLMLFILFDLSCPRFLRLATLGGFKDARFFVKGRIERLTTWSRRYFSKHVGPGFQMSKLFVHTNKSYILKGKFVLEKVFSLNHVDERAVTTKIFSLSYKFYIFLFLMMNVFKAFGS